MDREMLSDIIIELANKICPNNNYDKFKQEVLKQAKEKDIKVDSDEILDILDIEGFI